MSDGITYKDDRPALECGYTVKPHVDFPATSLADTLYGKGKSPSFEERAKPQEIERLDEICPGANQIGKGK